MQDKKIQISESRLDNDTAKIVTTAVDMVKMVGTIQAATFLIEKKVHRSVIKRTLLDPLRRRSSD